MLTERIQRCESFITRSLLFGVLECILIVALCLRVEYLQHKQTTERQDELSRMRAWMSKVEDVGFRNVNGLHLRIKSLEEMNPRED